MLTSVIGGMMMASCKKMAPRRGPRQLRALFVRAALPLVRGALLLGVLLWAGQALATVDAVIKGWVRDELLQPIGGATVVLHDGRGRLVRQVKTEKDGSFLFQGIPFGEYSVESRASGRTDAHQHVLASSSEIVEVELYCVAQAEKAVIVEERELPRPSRSTGSVATLGREALKTLPLGEDRPITEVITTQPGFVQDAFGNVYARGTHSNLQYQIDGIPIPDSVGNLFAQALPVRLIDSVEILSGGLPAEFGNRLAAVVNINTRRGGTALDGLLQLRYGSFETLETSGYLSRSIGPVSFFVGGSYLQSERMLDPPAVSPILHDAGHSGRAFARFDYAPTPRDRLELFLNYAQNYFQIPIDPTVAPLDFLRPDLGRPVDQYGNEPPSYVPHDTDATEVEHEIFVAGSWTRSLNKKGQLQVAPYYKLSYGALSADALHALGALADPGATASDVRRRADHLGAVMHYSVSAGNHLVKAGLQFNYLLGSTSFTQYVRDDSSATGGIASGQGGSGTDRTDAVLAGVYLQDRWERGRLGLQYGLRLDWQHVMLVSSQPIDQWGISPRLGASFSFLKDLVGHAFVGVNFQPPAPLDAANAGRVLGVVPADAKVPYDIQAETNVYGELGLTGRILKKLKLGAVGWGRYAWNQLDNVAIGATNLIANYNFEHGRAVGVEVTADFLFRDWLSAFANASWLIAQGQGISSAKFLFDEEALTNTAWQTLDHAQSWTANAGVTLAHSGATFSVLANYGSGLRTGPANDQSVPQHVRFDASLQYAFDMLPLKPRVAIDATNLFDARYAYRIGNGFVGSSYAAPRAVFVRLSIPINTGAASGRVR